jgi:uncharacterized protein YuzE
MDTEAGLKKRAAAWLPGSKMRVIYNRKRDLFYLRFDDRKQSVINRRVSEDIVLDLGEDDKIVGIEILDASKHLNLERLLPTEYGVSSS